MKILPVYGWRLLLSAGLVGQTYAPLRWNFLGPEPFSVATKARKGGGARPRTDVEIC